MGQGVVQRRQRWLLLAGAPWLSQGGGQGRGGPPGRAGAGVAGTGMGWAWCSCERGLPQACQAGWTPGAGRVWCGVRGLELAAPGSRGAPAPAPPGPPGHQPAPPRGAWPGPPQSAARRCPWQRRLQPCGRARRAGGRRLQPRHRQRVPPGHCPRRWGCHAGHHCWQQLCRWPRPRLGWAPPPSATSPWHLSAGGRSASRR